MSRVDPECFSSLSSNDRVCSACFGDADLKSFIRRNAGPRGCSFCRRKDSPTIPFDELAEHIVNRLSTFYGRAVDQLPYETREGGYQGWHVDTYDLLTEEVGLDLPRDINGNLRDAIIDSAGDGIWCEFDWLVLEPNESLKFSWQNFSSIVKYQRRFFFHDVGRDPEEFGDPDSRSPAELLSEVCSIVDRQKLIKCFAAGTKYFRARPRSLRKKYTSAADLGPPPKDYALQSNRMNPPGISMFYGASQLKLATAEVRSPHSSIGTFITKRSIRLLDLAKLPEIPGFFSEADRMDIKTLDFLHDFVKLITKAVPRDDRVNIDYIPTQVFTEFLRDHPFKSGKIDGLMYPSATGTKGVNVVLFAGPEDVENDTEKSDAGSSSWLKLSKVRQV